MPVQLLFGLVCANLVRIGAATDAPGARAPDVHLRAPWAIATTDTPFVSLETHPNVARVIKAHTAAADKASSDATY